MNERIYLSPPDVTQLEEDAVIRAIRSGWIAPLGPDVEAFEQEIANRTDRAHAVALSSGTAALHLALLAQNIGPGDVVVTSSMTFAATANAIKYTGAEPYFVDSEPMSGNIDPDLLDHVIDELTAAGESPAAILPVDLLGKSADYTRIMATAERTGIPVIADAAESLGASHRDRPAGSFGVAAALSFNGNKIMTTSGGGMLLTDDEALASHIRYLATQARQPVVHYEHTDIGYNYRLSNLLAALGRAQLSRLNDMIARRRELRSHYCALFEPVEGTRLLSEHDAADDNFWLSSIVVDPDVAGWHANDLREWLAEVDIESRPLWKPMHLQPVFAGARAAVTGVSQRLFEQGLTLPSGSAMTDDQFNRVSQRITEFLKR